MGSYTLFFPYPFSSLPCSLPLRFSWPIEAEWRKGHWLLSEWNFPVLGPSKSTKSKHKQTNKKLRGRQSWERGKLGKGEGERAISEGERTTQLNREVCKPKAQA